MSTRNWLHGPCYERRTVLALALTPWLVSAARADDAATMPPQPDDRFVFLTGPKKGQVVKIDDLVLGTGQEHEAIIWLRRHCCGIISPRGADQPRRQN